MEPTLPLLLIMKFLPWVNTTEKVHVCEPPAESVTEAVTWWVKGDVGKVPVTWVFTAAPKLTPVALYETGFTVPEPPVTVATGKTSVTVAALHWYCPFWFIGQVIANDCVTVEKMFNNEKNDNSKLTDRLFKPEHQTNKKCTTQFRATSLTAYFYNSACCVGLHPRS